MSREYLLSERFTKIFFRMLVGSVVIMLVGFLVFGIRIFRQNKAKKIATLELRGEVEQVYQKDTHDLTWWVVTLKDSDKEITLENSMIRTIKPGDSLFKKAGQDFYLLRDHRSGELKKYWVTQ